MSPICLVHSKRSLSCTFPSQGLINEKTVLALTLKDGATTGCPIAKGVQKVDTLSRPGHTHQVTLV